MKKLMIIMLAVGLVFSLTACKGKGNSSKKTKPTLDQFEMVDVNRDIFPVERTTDGIIFEEERVVEIGNFTHKVDFYRNLSYDAGLEGKYTFMVINPHDEPSKDAPLWVYLHGGAGGYFSEDGEYHAITNQDERTWNVEETFDFMLEGVLAARIYTNGELEDNTLTRRLEEGYRVLQVSYSDHDYYVGLGTEYPNNPNGGDVNGLQATMSAMDYVVDNYDTTYVFTHGTSAGAIGAYALAVAYQMEGVQLTGVVSDSMLPTLDMMYIMEEFNGKEGFKHGASFEYAGMMNKVGAFGDSSNGLTTANMIYQGFDVPLFGIGGRLDPFFADNVYTHPLAVEMGYHSNADWLHRHIIDAIDGQSTVPHRVEIYDETGHVPTVKEHGFAHDSVDDFIESSIEYNSGYPFKESNVQNLVFSEAPFDLGNVGAKFAEDISYDEYEETKFDIFLPNSEEPTGLVIYIHGGGFRAGDKTKLYSSNGDQRLIKELLSEDIAVASINYRLLTQDDEDGILKCLNDSKRALQYIRYHSDTFNIRKEDVVLMGGSAGSGTSLWLAVNDDMKDINSPDPILRESTRVKGIAVSGTQATYDFTLWSSVVFAEFDMDIDDIADLNNESNDTPMYGSISYMELDNPEVIEYRDKVDMLSKITADDPEIWASSTGTSNGAPQSQSDRNHHGYHVKAIKEKADEVGVDMTCEYGNPLLYQSDNFESKVDFLIRKVNE